MCEENGEVVTDLEPNDIEDAARCAERTLWSGGRQPPPPHGVRTLQGGNPPGGNPPGVSTGGNPHVDGEETQVGK